MSKANVLEKVHLLRWELHKYNFKISASSNYMATSVLVHGFRVFCISSESLLNDSLWQRRNTSPGTEPNLKIKLQRECESIMVSAILVKCSEVFCCESDNYS